MLLICWITRPLVHNGCLQSMLRTGAGGAGEFIGDHRTAQWRFSPRQTVTVVLCGELMMFPPVQTYAHVRKRDSKGYMLLRA